MMKHILTFIIHIIYFNTYSQNIKNDIEMLQFNKDEIEIKSLSNIKYKIIYNIDYQIIIENLLLKEKLFFNNYLEFKKHYEITNPYIILPNDIKELFEDIDLYNYELKIKNRIKNQDIYILNELMQKYELSVFPNILDNNNIWKLDEEFKDFRINKELNSEFRILFSYYFINYIKSKLKVEDYIYSMKNILNQEIFIPSIKIDNQIIDIYGIVRTNEFINRTISPIILKNEIDNIIYEFTNLK